MFRSLVTPFANNVRQFSTARAVRASKQFVVVIRDFKDPECLERRLAIREKHLVGATEDNKKGIINVAGAILDNHESRKMKGSVYVMTAESADEVEKFIKKDPYYKAKVWEEWDILPVNLECIDMFYRLQIHHVQ